MKSIHSIGAGFILILTCLGCSRHENIVSKHTVAPSKTIVEKREYRYFYADNTGIPDFVEDQGKQRAIKFRADSNQPVVTSLRKSISKSLQKIGNHIEKRMVIGKLYPKVLWTPDEPNMSMSEPYQEFTLYSWRFKK